MVPVHHRTTQIDGLDLFFREAGPAQAPALVLLHVDVIAGYLRGFLGRTLA